MNHLRGRRGLVPRGGVRINEGGEGTPTAWRGGGVAAANQPVFVDVARDVARRDVGGRAKEGSASHETAQRVLAPVNRPRTPAADVAGSSQAAVEGGTLRFPAMAARGGTVAVPGVAVELPKGGDGAAAGEDDEALVHRLHGQRAATHAMDVAAKLWEDDNRFWNDTQGSAIVRIIQEARARRRIVAASCPCCTCGMDVDGGAGRGGLTTAERTIVAAVVNAVLFRCQMASNDANFKAAFRARRKLLALPTTGQCLDVAAISDAVLEVCYAMGCGGFPRAAPQWWVKRLTGGTREDLRQCDDAMDDYFKEKLRMLPRGVREIAETLSPLLQRRVTFYRVPLQPDHIIAYALYRWATGETYDSGTCSFGIGRAFRHHGGA
ncbi:hypothetical protein CBR_g12853 [Chara braunii]|uniref:Uncharacterized protein n=1 Tax=Chara braunii TaxID=69332 RepID=A0A388KSW3_CHABU|nr:hypothetical protein CBR_g12853 [Chara braunii]|eukprot:GBG73136.1 hypothetical protein CBR_g12853 [Chara braunii]